MSLIIIEGPHHVGKTTLVEETCAGFPQPKCTHPEDLESFLVESCERYALSDDIAVFDHFPLFGYPVKFATGAEERFFREYSLSIDALRYCEWLLVQSREAGKLMLVGATLPAEMLPGQEKERELFAALWGSWRAVPYDYTKPQLAEECKRQIRAFIARHADVVK